MRGVGFRGLGFRGFGFRGLGALGSKPHRDGLFQSPTLGDRVSSQQCDMDKTSLDNWSLEYIIGFHSGHIACYNPLSGV